MPVKTIEGFDLTFRPSADRQRMPGPSGTDLRSSRQAIKHPEGTGRLPPAPDRLVGKLDR